MDKSIKDYIENNFGYTSDKLSRIADKLRSQNFAPNDVSWLSAINHPLTAAQKGADWFAGQVNRAANIPEQYDNPNPLAGYTPEQQVGGALNLAGLMQTSAFPFAPKSAGGVLGTITKAKEKNLNAGLIEKYLQEGKLSPEEMAQYEANALAMETPNLQKYNLENANLQGGTPESRAGALGYSDNWRHGRYSDYEQINPNKTFYATKDPDYASIYAIEPSASSMGGKGLVDYESLKPNVMPVMIKENQILDTRLPEHSKIFNKDFYMKYGNATPLTDKKLPDWVEGEDFREMFEDVNPQFKGVYLDEGKIPTWEGGLKDRGISAAVFDPSIIRSRFAAFDPLRKASPSLLAGGALGSLLLNKEMNKGK